MTVIIVVVVLSSRSAASHCEAEGRERGNKWASSGKVYKGQWRDLADGSELTRE